MRFLSEDYSTCHLVWTISVICKSITVECDVKFQLWSNSIFVTSMPEIVDVIGWLTSIPLTPKSIIVEVFVYVAIPVLDDLDFSALIFSKWLSV